MREYEGTLRAVRTGPVGGLVGQVVLLAAIAVTVGLGPAGWVAGLASAALVDATLVHGLIRNPTVRLGPAGWVTLARATLALGVAALAADSFVRPVPVALLVGLAAVALALDYVDGEVARRTGTESELGGRLDGEVDAFLILALSVYVAPIAGAWVLAIGAARYVFLAAGWALPWMRARLPRRDWRKTVAATQGIVLAVAGADVLPLPLVEAALAIALAMLAESFGRDVLWLWRRRRSGARTPASGTPSAPRGRIRTAVGIAFTAAAVVLVWGALVAPNRPNDITFDAFARVPLEGLIVIALALVLPRNARRVLAWIVGPLLGVLVVVKLLDVGFFAAFDRPFNPVEDCATRRSASRRCGRRSAAPVPTWSSPVSWSSPSPHSSCPRWRCCASPGSHPAIAPSRRGRSPRWASPGRCAGRSGRTWRASRSPRRALPSWPSTRCVRSRRACRTAPATPPRSATTAMPTHRQTGS